MLLSELLEGILPMNPACTDCEVTDIRADSREITEGALYVCIRGTKADGHDFAAKAMEKGCCAVVCEHPCGTENEILAKDTREAYALLCNRFFNAPAAGIQLAAVTGTNGKTSVATIIYRLLRQAGLNAGLLSTIQAEYGLTMENMERTTPDARELCRILRRMADSGVTAAAMEASSHALDQKRLFHLHFAVAIFTNLTQDHLDYHKSMVHYFEAKQRLFTMADFAVINLDDPYGKQLAAELQIPFESYAIFDPAADYYADNIICSASGVKFDLHFQGTVSRVRFGIPGLYSVHNALAAIAACRRLGMSIDSILVGLRRIGVIRGRSEVIGRAKGFTVLCDYAHTPDGLENILKTTRAYTEGKLWLVFGCGGDRDKEKRPLMGKVAARYADKTVITSDNPRTERPNAILADILRGFPDGKEPMVIPDRKDAVRYALVNARKGDVVLLAGKGHEEYQVLADKKLYFDERRLVRGILRTL